MIQAVSTYIKGIAIFLVLIAYAELIMPDSKYKDYINLVLGLVLLFLLIKPAGSLINKAYSTPAVSKYNILLDKGIMNNEQALYEESRKTLVLDTYKSELKKQTAEILSEYGEVTLLGIDVSERDEDFGSIMGIYAEIVPNEEAAGKKKKLVRIERVRINERTAKDSTEEIYDEQIKIIKNRISDFYNLSGGNIHIKILKKK